MATRFVMHGGWSEECTQEGRHEFCLWESWEVRREHR